MPLDLGWPCCTDFPTLLCGGLCWPGVKWGQMKAVDIILQSRNSFDGGLDPAGSQPGSSHHRTDLYRTVRRSSACREHSYSCMNSRLQWTTSSPGRLKLLFNCLTGLPGSALSAFMLWIKIIPSSDWIRPLLCLSRSGHLQHKRQ